MLAIACATILNAQNFQNGDLEGTVTTVSQLPSGWQAVPDTDPACLATNPQQATPDLTGFTGPDMGNGIMGNPYSGNSFVSGLRAGGQMIFHEGIKQTIAGLTVGQTYTLSFYQTVVKQSNALDRSGSWSVYINGTLALITAPTHSNAPVGSISLIWERRTVSFTATTSSAYFFKFLPEDDDSNVLPSLTDTTGSLRMGIDLIDISTSEVGFAEASLSLAAHTYPNPSHGEFILDLGGAKTDGNAPIEVLDITGQMILSLPAEDQQVLHIDLRDRADGIYFIRIKLADGNTPFVKVLKE